MYKLSLLTRTAALMLAAGVAGCGHALPSSAPAMPAMQPAAIVNASQFGQNLILNGDAESSPGASASNTVPPVDWKTTGHFTAEKYGSSNGGPTAHSPGPADRGKNYFAGGDEVNKSTATQSISLAASAGAINTGKVQYTFEAWLGGYEDQRDHATATVTFESAQGAALASKTLGPVMVAYKKGVTGLWLRTYAGTVPKHTVTAVVKMIMTRKDGSYNDGYADSLSLVLKKS